MEVAEKYQEYAQICGFLKVFGNYLTKLNNGVPIPRMYDLKLYFEDNKESLSDDNFWHFICGLLVHYHNINNTHLHKHNVATLNVSSRQRKSWLILFCEMEELEVELKWIKEDRFDDMPLRQKIHFFLTLLEAQLDVDNDSIEKELQDFSGDALRLKPFGRDKLGNLYFKFDDVTIDKKSMLLKESFLPNSKENSVCVLFKRRARNDLKLVIQALKGIKEDVYCNNNENCKFDSKKDAIRCCNWCELEWHTSCIADPFLHGDDIEETWICPECDHKDLINNLGKL